MIDDEYICDETHFSTLVDVVVVSIDRGTNDFYCFASGLEIAFPFAVCKGNSMLIECVTS